MWKKTENIQTKQKCHKIFPKQIFSKFLNFKFNWRSKNLFEIIINQFKSK